MRVCSTSVAFYTFLALASAAPHRNWNGREQCTNSSNIASPTTSFLPSSDGVVPTDLPPALPEAIETGSLPQMNITALGNGTFVVDMSNGTHTTLTYNASLGAPGITQASRRPVTTISVTAGPVSNVARNASITPSRTSTSIGDRAASSVIAGPAVRTGKVEYGGINIAGFDFHCKTDGTCRLDEVEDVVSNGKAIPQMQHFVKNDGLNTFRLPVSWQFLVNDRLGRPLDEGNFAAYDKLVQGCLDTGAKLCIIDVHNYARWNGRIIGQGGPTNQQFARLWSQIAQRYADVPNIAFDIMNEPHDLDLERWTVSVQAAVTAIREAGAIQQIILLPGTDYMSAKSFVSSGSAQALSSITNPDGTKERLVYNVHRYLDFDHSGRNSECVTNNIDESFAPLAKYLREHGRTAMLTETGGGPNDDGCMRFFCEQMDFINQNSDVFQGVVTWAAGGFPTDYEISETPFVEGDKLVDQPLVTQCIVDKIGRQQQ